MVRKNSMISHAKGESQLAKQKKAAQATIEVATYDETLIQQIDEYNANITKLDPKFAELKMVNQVLVRCFLNKPYISPEGTIQPYPAVVEVQTAHGITSRLVENDFNYDFKAVVVSAPESFKSMVKPGDIVVIKEICVKPKVLGSEKGGFVQIMPSAFNYPTGIPFVGTKLGDRDHGYILVNYPDVVAVLGQNGA